MLFLLLTPSHDSVLDALLEDLLDDVGFGGAKLGQEKFAALHGDCGLTLATEVAPGGRGEALEHDALVRAASAPPSLYLNRGRHAPGWGKVIVGNFSHFSQYGNRLNLTKVYRGLRF